ncbi:MAG: PD-(D/E)XK nuclease family protein, partial [Winogradskyella arenosi]
MSVSVEDLENFIVNAQPELETIKRELSAFNIFNVLGVQYREIRHSNFLGWLFDPNESHQLGDIFLKDLFKLIREVSNSCISSEKLVSLLLEDLSQTIVHRESENNIDILIINETLDILICIENKIHANYSSHQLSKYYQYIEENYQEITNRVYLTLTPFESHNHLDFTDGDKYQNINYNQIIDVIKGNESVINKALPTVKESINQYITMTEKNITFSSKETKLAQEIYSKYKDEINFIINSRSDFKGFKDVLWKYVEDGHLE